MLPRNKTSRKPVGSGSLDRPSNEYSTQTSQLTASPYINATGSPKYTDSWHREPSEPPLGSNRNSTMSDEFFDTENSSHTSQSPHSQPRPSMPDRKGSQASDRSHMSAGEHSDSSKSWNATFPQPLSTTAVASTSTKASSPTASPSPSAVTTPPTVVPSPTSAYSSVFPSTVPLRHGHNHDTTSSSSGGSSSNQTTTTSSSKQSSFNSKTTPKSNATEWTASDISKGPSPDTRKASNSDARKAPTSDARKGPTSDARKAPVSDIRKGPTSLQKAAASTGSSATSAPAPAPTATATSALAPTSKSPTAKAPTAQATASTSSTVASAPKNPTSAVPLAALSTHSTAPSAASTIKASTSNAEIDQNVASTAATDDKSAYASQQSTTQSYPSDASNAAYAEVPQPAYGYPYGDSAYSQQNAMSQGYIPGYNAYDPQTMYYKQGNDSQFMGQSSYSVDTQQVTQPYPQDSYYDPSFMNASAYYQDTGATGMPSQYGGMPPMAYGQHHDPNADSQQSLPYSTVGSVGEYAPDAVVAHSDTSSSSVALPYDTGSINSSTTSQSVSQPNAVTGSTAALSMPQPPVPTPAAVQAAPAAGARSASGGWRGPPPGETNPSAIYRNVGPSSGSLNRKISLKLTGFPNTSAASQLSPSTPSNPSALEAVSSSNSGHPSSAHPSVVDSPMSARLKYGAQPGSAGAMSSTNELVNAEDISDVRSIRSSASGFRPPNRPASKAESTQNPDLGIGKGSEYVQRMRADAGETHTSRQPASSPLGSKRTNQKSPFQVKPEFSRRAMDIRYTHLPQRMLETEVDDDDEPNNIDERGRGMPPHGVGAANNNDRMRSGSRSSHSGGSPRASFQSQRSSSPADSIIEQTGKIKLFVANPDDD